MRITIALLASLLVGTAARCDDDKPIDGEKLAKLADDTASFKGETLTVELKLTGDGRFMLRDYPNQVLIGVAYVGRARNRVQIYFTAPKDTKKLPNLHLDETALFTIRFDEGDLKRGNVLISAERLK